MAKCLFVFFSLQITYYLTANMKNRENLKLNICIISAFFALMLTAFASFSYAASVPDASGQIDSSDGAILRQSASTSSGKLTVLSDNTNIVIHKEVFVSKTSTSKENKWFYITASGKNGYVRSDLVDNIKYGSVSGKTTESVNYRYGPGTEMKKKSSFSKNTNITVVMSSEPVYSTRGTSATWYKIKVGSDYYYLCSSKAKLTDSSSQASGGSSSGSSAASAPSSANNSGSSGITASAQVNSSVGAILRQSTSTDSGNLGVIADNTNIVIQKEIFTSKTSTSKENKWYYVTADGRSGYLRSDLVDNIKYGSVSGKTTESVNYRYGPGTEMKKKSSFSKNSNVTIVMSSEPVYSTRGTSATWYKIKMGSDYYYLCSSKVKLTGSFTPAAGGTSSGSSAPAAPSAASTAGSANITAFAQINSSGGAILRQSTSTGSGNLGVLADDTNIVIQKEVFTSKTSTSKENKWYYVTADGRSGYIRSDLVDNIKYGSASGKTTESVNYRYGPGTEMKKKSSYSKNTNVTVVLQAEPVYATRGTSSTWYKIKIGSDYYYMCSSKVKLTGTFTPAAGTPASASSASGSTDAQFIKSLSSAGFPDSYKKGLTELHKAHPNWVFVAYRTNVAWNTALSKQTSGGTSLVSGSFPASYRDGTKQYEKGWYKANSKVVAYYMDPRNFLNENSIYMFEDLSYKPKYQTASVVGAILSPTRLPANGFTAGIFVKAGEKSNVSPVFLASRARQETGNGSDAITGTKVLGTKVYNAFNIGAFGGTNPLYNGLLYAYAKGWTTPEKAVEGGAQELAKNYINNGQYTGYYQRFNVRNGAAKVGTHQYMTNIMAPYSEASSTKASYTKYGILNQPLVFEIPIYEGMPASTKLP